MSKLTDFPKECTECWLDVPMKALGMTGFRHDLSSHLNSDPHSWHLEWHSWSVKQPIRYIWSIVCVLLWYPFQQLGKLWNRNQEIFLKKLVNYFNLYVCTFNARLQFAWLFILVKSFPLSNLSATILGALHLDSLGFLSTFQGVDVSFVAYQFSCAPHATHVSFLALTLGRFVVQFYFPLQPSWFLTRCVNALTFTWTYLALWTVVVRADTSWKLNLNLYGESLLFSRHFDWLYLVYKCPLWLFHAILKTRRLLRSLF